MRIRKIWLLIIFSFPLSGCGAALEHWENQNNFMVAADDLDPTIDGKYANPFIASNNNKNYVGEVVNDSELKCSKFLNGLALASNTTNVGLDMTTTVFSALATAFSPIATIHALTAGATISSGWKTSIDSDIYAKASIGNYAQAIQASYYTAINNYMTSLTTMSDSQVVAALEVAKLRTIHKDCSLSSAQSTISATLQNSTSQTATPNSTDTWTIGSFNAGDKIVLTATASNLPNGKIDISTTVKSGEKAADVATDLLQAINTNADLQKSNVSSAHGSNATTIVLSSPASLALKWSSTSTALKHQTSGTSPANQSSAPSGALSGSSPVTTGSVPGSSLK